MACLGMESAMLHIWMAWSSNQGGGSRKCGSVQFASCFGKHDTLHQIVDDETGEKVLVWGVDGSELPVVSRRELRWNPTKVAIPGDIDEDRLYRSSSYSIPRAVQTHKNGSKWVGTEVGNRLGIQKSTKYCDPEQEIVAAKKKWSEHADRQNYEYSLLDTFFSIRSLKTIGAEEQIIQALASLQIYRPSHIQALAFQPVAKGRSCIIADQTGSGKSLAYLAPLIQRMKHDEVTGASTSLPRRPRVLILVPTGELAVQILNVCKGFSKSGCPFKSMVATGSFRWRTQVDNLDNGPDILIATPGRFLHLVNEEKLLLDNLKSAVFDEVDILFEDQDFTEVVDKLDKSPASLTIQYLHVTATLPVEIHDSLLKRYPDAMPLIGPNLHRTAAGLQEVLVDCSGDNEVSTETAFLNKKAALLQLVERRSVPKTIIFCNKIETCRRVENILNRFDRSKSKIYAYPYHAAVKQECRLKNLQDFLHSATTKPSFLVCTDRASRGLDPIDVEHVILFDFPRDPSEYVRRVGRTARAGRDGKVYVFAVGKQVGLARRIMTRNEKGHPIHSVPLDA